MVFGPKTKSNIKALGHLVILSLSRACSRFSPNLRRQTFHSHSDPDVCMASSSCHAELFLVSISTRKSKPRLLWKLFNADTWRLICTTNGVLWSNKEDENQKNGNFRMRFYLLLASFHPPPPITSSSIFISAVQTHLPDESFHARSASVVATSV